MMSAELWRTVSEVFGSDLSRECSVSTDWGPSWSIGVRRVIVSFAHPSRSNAFGVVTIGTQLSPARSQAEPRESQSLDY
jgi:hypothetical protein